MTTFLLIRHAQTDSAGTALSGRMGGVHLNEEGRAQADELARHLRRIQVAAIYSSPLERAKETATPLAARFGIEVQSLNEIGELNFGDWTGHRLDDLAGDAQWHRFNAMRSMARIPGGEMMIEAQARMIAALERLRLAHGDETVAIISHGDIIKAAVAHFLGVPLDLFQRIEVSPASISVVVVEALAVRVLMVNHRVDMMARDD
jgi:probable phosphomutase (TIGR03848 family)